MSEELGVEPHPSRASRVPPEGELKRSFKRSHPEVSPWKGEGFGAVQNNNISQKMSCTAAI